MWPHRCPPTAGIEGLAPFQTEGDTDLGRENVEMAHHWKPREGAAWVVGIYLVGVAGAGVGGGFGYFVAMLGALVLGGVLIGIERSWDEALAGKKNRPEA